MVYGIFLNRADRFRPVFDRNEAVNGILLRHEQKRARHGNLFRAAATLWGLNGTCVPAPGASPTECRQRKLWGSFRLPVQPRAFSCSRL